MFGNRRLAAALLLVSVVGACGSGGASTAPLSTASIPAPSPVGPSNAVDGATATSAAPATAGTGIGGPVANGGDYCGLLGPGDFTAAGISGTKAPIENYDDSGNYYCVYAGDSGATGGIEFDAFVGDPAGTYKAMAEGAGILTADATSEVIGADKAGTVVNGPGGSAGIAVCKGQFCFDIDIPTSATARTQLIALAVLVLQRGSGLTA